MKNFEYVRDVLGKGYKTLKGFVDSTMCPTDYDSALKETYNVFKDTEHRCTLECEECWSMDVSIDIDIIDKEVKYRTKKLELESKLREVTIELEKCNIELKQIERYKALKVAGKLNECEDILKKGDVLYNNNYGKGSGYYSIVEGIELNDNNRVLYKTRCITKGGRLTAKYISYGAELVKEGIGKDFKVICNISTDSYYEFRSKNKLVYRCTEYKKEAITKLVEDLTDCNYEVLIVEWVKEGVIC